MQAKLVAVDVKPAPENGFEYIGPPLNVIFAVSPLRTEVDVILCGSAVEQLEELRKYRVVKPNVPLSECSFSPEHENLMDQNRVKVTEFSDSGEILPQNILPDVEQNETISVLAEAVATVVECRPN